MVRVSNYWILLLGGGLTFLSFFYIDRHERLDRVSILKSNLVSVENKINAELKKVDLMIESLSFFIENTPEINQLLFEEFTAPFLKELNGIKALEWAPLVDEAERVNYEKGQNLSVNSEFYITQKSENNSLKPAIHKSHYYPVQYVNPLATNEKALGYDLSSNTKRNQSILYSLKNGVVSFTRPIHLVQESNKSHGFLAIKHLNKSKYNSSGVVLGVYSMSIFINNILDYEFDVLDIDIYDSSANNAVLYTSKEKDYKHTDKKVFFEFETIAADRKWLVRCFDKNNMPIYPHTLGAYFVLFLGLLLTYSLFVIIKRKENYNTLLEEEILNRTKKLIQLNSQKDLLLKEIHHRVKNNMQTIKSLIGLQARYVEDEKIKKMFQSSKYRIDSMALVHEMLYKTDDFSKVSGKAYVLNLINELIYSFKGENNDVELKEAIASDVQLNIDTAIPLGLIITEIITNSLKYGNNKKGAVINVGLKSIGKSNFELSVSDNGPGFVMPNKENVKSLGLRLIDRLISQLNGTKIKVDSVDGTKYIISFQEISN